MAINDSTAVIRIIASSFAMAATRSGRLMKCTKRVYKESEVESEVEVESVGNGPSPMHQFRGIRSHGFTLCFKPLGRWSRRFACGSSQ